MNSCRKVVRSIRNTTLNLCADCAKQFVRKVQNCGQTNYGFCTMITHQLIHWYLYVCFWSKHTHPWLFPLPKTEGTDERKAYCYDLGDKWKIETEAVEDTKKRLSKVLLTIFFDCTMAWCIMISCHKDVRSIRNTSLKLKAACLKQFVRNKQNCGKTNRGFCTRITHQLSYRFLCMSFWPKTKP